LLHLKEEQKIVLILFLKINSTKNISIMIIKNIALANSKARFYKFFALEPSKAKNRFYFQKTKPIKII
jgi:hypothetical protein